jgi:hypothetical protein
VREINKNVLYLFPIYGIYVGIESDMLEIKQLVDLGPSAGHFDGIIVSLYIITT